MILPTLLFVAWKSRLRDWGKPNPAARHCGCGNYEQPQDLEDDDQSPEIWLQYLLSFRELGHERRRNSAADTRGPSTITVVTTHHVANLLCSAEQWQGPLAATHARTGLRIRSRIKMRG